jgi:hypothetical protein
MPKPIRKYDAALEKVAQVLRDLALQCRPTSAVACALAGGGATGLAAGEDGPGRPARPAQHLRPSAREFLDGWFEDDHVKSAFAFDAVVGNLPACRRPVRPMCCCTTCSAR